MLVGDILMKGSDDWRKMDEERWKDDRGKYGNQCGRMRYKNRKVKWAVSLPMISFVKILLRLRAVATRLTSFTSSLSIYCIAKTHTLPSVSARLLHRFLSTPRYNRVRGLRRPSLILPRQSPWIEPSKPDSTPKSLHRYFIGQEILK